MTLKTVPLARGLAEALVGVAERRQRGVGRELRRVARHRGVGAGGCEAAVGNWPLGKYPKMVRALANPGKSHQRGKWSREAHYGPRVHMLASLAARFHRCGVEGPSRADVVWPRGETFEGDGGEKLG